MARLLSNRYVCFCRLGRIKDTKSIKPLGKTKKILTALPMKMKMPLGGKCPTLYYALVIWQTQTPVLGGFSSSKTAWRACRAELHQLTKRSKPQSPAPNPTTWPQTSCFTGRVSGEKNIHALRALRAVLHVAKTSFNSSPLICNTMILLEHQTVDFPYLLDCFMLLFKYHRDHDEH